MIWKFVNPLFPVIARSAATWQSVPKHFKTLGGPKAAEGFCFSYFSINLTNCWSITAISARVAPAWGSTVPLLRPEMIPE